MKNNEEKVDKGFELVYYKLSNRRKFIRTLWMFPWAVLAVWLIYARGFPLILVILVGIIIAVTFTMQACYTYRKWKEED